MRRLLWFLAGVAAATALALSVRIPEPARFATLESDAVRLQDIRARIDDNPRPIDIAFLGSSHTMSGINDEKVEAELRRAGLDLHVANLGNINTGRDMQLFWLRRLLREHRPKLILIEIVEFENESGHKLLPYIGELRDMLCCKFYVDPRFPLRLVTFLRQRLIYGARILLGVPPDLVAVDMKDFGWWRLDRQWSREKFDAARAAPGMLERAKRRLHGLASGYGLNVVDQMLAAARKQGIEVAFVYLPSVQYVDRPNPLDRAVYAQRAPIIGFPASLGNDPDFWADEGHLNTRGADALAPVVARGIRSVLPDRR